MTKKLLLFTFFLGNLFVHGQTDYGILVISTLSPSRGWDGSHAGSLSLTLGNKSIFKSSSTSDEVEIEYDFFYVTDNPSKIDYRSATAGNKNDTDCQIKDSTPFNIATFSRDAFGGCIGDFEVLSMNIPIPVYPETNQKCVEDIITLKNGWNWQYQFDGAGWAPFPSQFQEKASISFQLKDLPNYKSTGDVRFRAGYQQQFAKIVTYNIIPCSPRLGNTSDPNYTTCSYSNGGVTFTFSRPLEPGEKYLFNRNPVGSTFITDATSNDPDVEKISALSYKWKNIPVGVYEFKYQTQFGSNTPSTLSPVTKFEIKQSTPLTFTATAVQPVCSTDEKGIRITASGGSNSYYYLLDGEPLSQKHAFTSPHTIKITTDGAHKVIVVDSSDCIEQ
ncbi:hypothetical protein [Flavobacterium sp. B183]|uniref:hypothetical protein n=1 Tax=Flavobacterium sp. B183 TaxID=907046 RepID=UPI00201F0C67|nr:hypothetical protein [Flavobacterium sp. B183]URC11011.1 hypothetical protein M4I44_13000 [Flavobacterium sp. B183]